MKDLHITSPSFQDGEFIPKKHTGFGEDISPALHIDGLSPKTKSLAITLDDLDIPFSAEYCHWCIWNLPVIDLIPENISPGEMIPELANAVQGIAFGKHCYRGPKQPVFIRSVHHYRFTIYAIDTILQLKPSAGKPELLKAMEGHILQTGKITGKYKR